MTTHFSGDQIAKITDYRTRAGELADFLTTLKLQGRDDEHNQETWVRLQEDPNNPGHMCGTPQCALGWAVHAGLVPDTRIAILSTAENLANRGIPFDAAKPFVDATKPTYYEHKFEVPSNRAFGIGANVQPVTGNTFTWWEDVGAKHYGDVVLSRVFNATELTLQEVIDALREYAATGRIKYNEEYYHAHDEDLSCTLMDADDEDA